MLKLPNKFKNYIINRYGEKGKKWLNNIDTIVDKYVRQFELYDVQLAPNLTMNVVLFAKSNLYGDVAVKIGSPSKTTITEINIMKYYSSKYIPKCYYYSVNDRVMILEKLSPGYSLKHLDNMEERIKIFSDLSNHLLIPANNTTNFPTFEKSFKEKIEYAYSNKEDFSDILYMIDIAESLYHKIENMNLPKYILHDDLHHKNILKSGNNWKAIDPHGVVGEKVLETAHFIRAELELLNSEEDNIDKIVSLLSNYFLKDKTLILESLYVVIITKIIWYTSIRYDNNIISYNIDICKKVLNLVSPSGIEPPFML